MRVQVITALALLTTILAFLPVGIAARTVFTRALKQTIPTPGAVLVPTTLATAPGVVTTINVPIATGPSTTLGPAPAPATGSVLHGIQYSPVVGPPIQNTSSPECLSISRLILDQCPQFTKYTQDASKAGTLTTQSASQIAAQALMDNPKPTPECCASYKQFLVNGCRCDARIQQGTRNIGTQPGALAAGYVYYNAACNFDKNYDTAPAVCPGEPPVAATTAAGK